MICVGIYVPYHRISDRKSDKQMSWRLKNSKPKKKKKGDDLSFEILCRTPLHFLCLQMKASNLQPDCSFCWLKSSQLIDSSFYKLDYYWTHIKKQQQNAHRTINNWHLPENSINKRVKSIPYVYSLMVEAASSASDKKRQTRMRRCGWKWSISH